MERNECNIQNNEGMFDVFSLPRKQEVDNKEGIDKNVNRDEKNTYEED